MDMNTFVGKHMQKVEKTHNKINFIKSSKQESEQIFRNYREFEDNGETFHVLMI